MGTWRTYIAPLRADGNYGDYQETTKYTIGNNVGKIRQKTEKDEYDIGVAPFSSINLKLNNSSGKFSEVGAANSIFEYRRGWSKVKITYLFGEYEPICGVAIAGIDVLGPEIDAFEGFISQTDSDQNVIDDTISFTVLGKTAIFGSLESIVTEIAPEDTISVAILKLLDQPEIYNLYTVSTANFNPTIDPLLSEISDDIDLEFLQETTVKEALDLLLEASASVLYIEDDIVYVTNREPNDGIKHYFYGQAASFGLENIQNISDYRDGLSRTFNFWKWSDTTITATSASSIADYGVLKHDDVDFKAVTVEAFQQTLLDTYLPEFATPKTEMKLTTFVNVEILALRMFDKVSIDYPNVPISAGAGNMPKWNTGSMVWQDEDDFDTDRPFFTWPAGLFNIEIESSREWKIIGIETDSQKDLVALELREV